MRHCNAHDWHVYIVRCADGSLYAGISTDLAQRLSRHNAGRGSKYVRSKGTATVVYVEQQPSQSAARRRELEIQSWNRQKKLALIASKSRELVKSVVA